MKLINTIHVKLINTYASNEGVASTGIVPTLNTSDSIGLNNGVNGIAYAILKGITTYHKSIDLAFIEY